MKQEIITYLAGPRNFIQGVELYEKYGINRMLKKSFRRQGETETMKAILLEELRKLAGLSEREFKTIRRNSKQPAAVKMEPARQEPPKMPVKYSDDLLLELAESFGVSVEELVSSDFRDKVLSMDENADRVEELEEELDTRIFDRSQQPVCPTPVGIHIIEQAQNILVQANRIKNIIEEEKHSLTGTFKLGILPTVAPYLLPRFFPQLMKKYPDLDIRVVEMKTNDIKKALQTGEIDAGIVASLAGMEELQQTPLFYEQFFAYVSREDALFNNEVIRTSDLNGEQLWLLDEGHCFRDQLVRFCQMKSARASQLAYHLGSMETFMRMVESGKGVTFIPELAVLQLGDAQKELVRSFAIPCPTRQVVLLTNKNFIRHTLLEVLVKEIKLSVPKEMLSLKATQAVV